MAIDIEAVRTAETLSSQWQQEHQALEIFFDHLRTWAYQVDQHGALYFGEAAMRLGRLRQRLVNHFDRESDLADQFAIVKPETSPEVEANRRQVARDHTILLRRLDRLIEKLSALEPPYHSWQEAMQEIDVFIDTLEQHEEQESDSIAWLTPHGETEQPPDVGSS